MFWPLKRDPLFPDNVGCFGTVRKEDIHTGVDLYCDLGTHVQAVESGIVVGIKWFTGRYANTYYSDKGVPTVWWNNTMGILIEGKTGVINYGEVDPDSIFVQVGETVIGGQHIATINKSVLRSNKGRPMVMLHFELMKHGQYNFLWWDLNSPQPDGLIDPTNLLQNIAISLHSNKSTNTFDSALIENNDICINSIFIFDIAKYDGKQFIDPVAKRKDSDWWKLWGGRYELT